MGGLLGGGGGAKGYVCPPSQIIGGGLAPSWPPPPLPTPMEYSIIVWDSTSLHNRDAPRKLQNGSARVVTGFIRPTSLFYIRMRLTEDSFRNYCMNKCNK